MTDLVRPVAGQSLLDSDGAGTTSTSLIDAAFDVIEANEDSLTARTSSHMVTTDQYSDIAELTLNNGTSLTGWHAAIPDTIAGTASITSGTSVLTLVTGTWLGPPPAPSTLPGYVGSTIRVVGAGPAGADLQARITSFQESVAPFTHANLSVLASTTVTGAVWDFNRIPTLVTIGGETAVQCTLKSPNGVLTPTLYVNLTEIGYASGLTVTPGQTISADYLLSQATAESPITNGFARYAITLASGADMTGTLEETTFTTAEMAGHLLNNWYTVLVPVGSIGTVRSIGIKKILTGGSGTATAQWSLTNIHRTTTTPLDQAYNSQNSVAAIIPPSYPSTAFQQPMLPDPLKALVDLRPDHAWISGMGGVKNLREWALDETGVVDVSVELQDALDSLEPGDVLTMPPGAAYRCDIGLTMNIPDVTIDGCGAALIQGYPDDLFNGVSKIAQNENERIKIRATGVTLRNLRIFGGSITPANGSTFTAAGGATVSSTNMLLGALNASASFTNVPGRDWQGRTYQTLILSDNNHVANDCVVTLTDDDGVVIHTETLPVLTSTPTAYPIYSTPRNLFAGHTIKVTKGTATANQITLGQLRTYNNCGTVWTFTQFEFGHGIAVFEDNCTLDNIVMEAVQGDGIWIDNTLPTTGVRNLHASNIFIRGNGRQSLAICGGGGHRFENIYLLYSARHGVDVEPENAFTSAVDGWYVNNMVIWKCTEGPPFQASGPIWGRVRNVVVDGLRTYGTGGIGGGFMDSTFRNIELRAVPTTSNADSIMLGRNLTWENVRIDGSIDCGVTGVTTSNAGNDDGNTPYTATGLYLRNVLFQTPVNGRPYVQVKQIGVHLEDLRISNEVALDTTYAVGSVSLLPDTTYTNLDFTPQRALLPNSYPGVAIGQPWFPSGLDMKARGLSRVAYLSGGTTKGNNLGRFQEPVTAAATSKTIVFPAKTYPNVFTITLSNSTGGTLTAGTYHYRFAARNRFGGPVLATADQSVTIAGTAVNMTIDGLYDVPTGIQIDGITVYRGPVGGASGNYTTRYDIVPTGDLHALGGAGVNNNKRFPLTDLGATITPFGNNFYQGYTFPYTATTGAHPEDETGWEPDVNYAVFVEPSWQTTWRISARRRNGFDIEFGVAAPTGSNTVSWMIARF